MKSKNGSAQRCGVELKGDWIVTGDERGDKVTEDPHQRNLRLANLTRYSTCLS